MVRRLDVEQDFPLDFLCDNPAAPRSRDESAGAIHACRLASGGLKSILVVKGVGLRALTAGVG